MNNKKTIYLTLALFVLLLTSACGTKAGSEPAADTVNTQQPAESNQVDTSDNGDDTTKSDEQILVIIDQTPKPIEGNSFDFAVNKIPEGYALAEMQWISKDNLIVNSFQEAIEHGATGEDGFYISGDRQFSGFFYPDAMKGEEGQVVLLFKNEQGDELTWKKKITLN